MLACTRYSLIVKRRKVTEEAEISVTKRVETLYGRAGLLGENVEGAVLIWT